MKKIILYFILFGYLSNPSFCQFTEVDFSSGIVSSDYESRLWDNNQDCNERKIGFFSSLGITYDIKRWLKIEGILGYQERKALELLVFEGDNNNGLSPLFSFCKYPTSPQSDLFDSNIYKHLPNFKYVNIEIIPVFSLGNRLQLTGGIGMFGGLLLNKKQLVFTKDDLAESDHFFFEPPHNVSGEIRYYRYDLGIISKVSVSFQINERIGVGIFSKYYHSFSRINDTAVASGGFNDRNLYWRTYAGGLEVKYQL